MNFFSRIYKYKYTRYLTSLYLSGYRQVTLPSMLITLQLHLKNLMIRKDMQHFFFHKLLALNHMQCNIRESKTHYLVVFLVNIKAQRLCSFLNLTHDFICRALRSKTGFSFHKTLKNSKLPESSNYYQNNFGCDKEIRNIVWYSALTICFSNKFSKLKLCDREISSKAFIDVGFSLLSVTKFSCNQTKIRKKLIQQ